MANTRIGRTVSVAGNRKKATFSAWVKRAKLGESWIAKFGGDYSQGQMMQIGFDSSDGCFIVGDIPSASAVRLQSNRKFRDINAWYHYVVTFDTEQATASNRLKFYINGEQVTSFGTETYPTQNLELGFNRTGTYNNAWLGGRGESSYEFSGIMSHVHWCDGYAYDASAFGSTDSTTGEWKINTSPNVQYGTNGYFMLKDGNSLTDASGNGNNFSSLVGTLTKTEDNPSNIFATWNALDNINASTLSNGNTKINTVTGNYSPNTSTLRATQGKWYWEIKLVQDTSSGANEADMVGIGNNSVLATTTNPSSIGINYRGNGKIWNYGGTSETTGYATFSTGDIIMVAMDLSDATTGKLYFGVNGTWGNSGNPATGANSYDFTKGTEAWGAMVTTYSSGAAGIWEANFGNGYFGTTAVSSAGTNASGIGIFEYDVPANFTSLSTKGLNL